MSMRLLRGALWQRRTTTGLAILAVAIGASVASALLHVSRDVSSKVTRELRALGPNLLVLPAEGGDRFLDEAAIRARLSAVALDGAPLLYVAAHADDQPVLAIGADLPALRRLHPSWSLTPTAGVATEQAPSWMGKRLMRRLGVRPGDTLELTASGNGVPVQVVVGGTVDAGGPDDEAWWIPLTDAQRLSGLPGRLSLVQARVSGSAEETRPLAQRLEADRACKAVALHSLTAAEARLLERLQRLMALVTVAALLGAALCAFGSLTDLALERRREIALLKALGATPREIVRQFFAEAAVIGTIGGVAGWLLGLVMAEVVGREVFHSAIAPRWDVPGIVVALGLGVALLASLGPVRLALRVEPAIALKGD
jgi:putative ABC transport system permease protein